MGHQNLVVFRKGKPTPCLSKHLKGKLGAVGACFSHILLFGPKEALCWSCHFFGPKEFTWGSVCYTVCRSSNVFSIVEVICGPASNMSHFLDHQEGLIGPPCKKHLQKCRNQLQKYTNPQLIKPHNPILNCIHIWSTISNLSWASEVWSETLRKRQKVPAQTAPWPEDSILGRFWPNILKLIQGVSK